MSTIHAPLNKTVNTAILADNDNQLTGSSSPFLLQLDEYPLTATATATTTATATATALDRKNKLENIRHGNSALSPILSSSSSSASSASSSSVCSSNEEPPLIPEDHFYNHLQTHSSLLRIMLKRSLPSQVKVGHWYRLDLEVLDEFGMSIKGERAKGSNMRLACEILEQLEGETRQSKDWKIVWRALRYDAWEWTDETLHMTVCSGFDKSCSGGLEFKLIRGTNIDSNIKKSPRLYLHIVPTFESHQTIHALPLVLGPLSILGDDSSLIKTQQWKSSSCQSMYRTFKLGGMDRYFMIKEGWNLGTPGKMWDSALVISDLFIQTILQQPTSLENCHLLDLSAGTGTAGLLISFIYQYILPKHHQHNIKITLTDLPEALPLIHYNGQINGINTTTTPQLKVAPLSWGRAKDIQHIKKTLSPIDIIIASDVLYEPCNFAILVRTLVHLAEPGRTVVYLGYKRRGLKEPDEQCFFDLCQDDFEIQALGADERNDMVIGWERRVGKLTRTTDHMDGYGWLGPYTNDLARQSFNQTGVQIYRLVRKWRSRRVV